MSINVTDLPLTREESTRDTFSRIFPKAHQGFALLMICQFMVLWVCVESGVFSLKGTPTALLVLLPCVLLALLAGRFAPLAWASRHLCAVVLAYFSCALNLMTGAAVELRPGVLILLIIFRDTSLLFTATATFLVVAVFPECLSPFSSTPLAWSGYLNATIASVLGLWVIGNRDFVQEMIAEALGRLSHMKSALDKQRVSQELERTQLNLILLGVERAGEESREMLGRLLSLLQGRERRIFEQEQESARLSTVGHQADRNVVGMRSILDDLSQQTQAMHAQGQEGAASLKELQELFQSIVDDSAAILADFQGCSVLAEEISAVLGTIDAVNRATRLLALNAAVEAEKAGEKGRGFGVLAQEMRRLAQLIETSLTDIEFLLRDIQAAISAGANGAELFVEEVRRSSESTDLMTQQIEQVLSAEQAVEPLFQESRTQLDGQMQSVLSIAELTVQAESINRVVSHQTRAFATAVRQLEEGVGKIAILANDSSMQSPGPAPAESHELDPNRIRHVTHQIYRRFVVHLRRNYSFTLIGLVVLMLVLLVAAGGVWDPTVWLAVPCLGYCLWAFKRGRYADTCVVPAFLLPALAQAVSRHSMGQADLGLTCLILASITREHLAFAGFLGGAATLYLADLVFSTAPSIPPVLWLWACLLCVFCRFVSAKTRAEMRGLCRERAVLEVQTEQSNLDSAVAEHLRTANTARLLDELASFCLTLETSGGELEDMGQGQEEGNRHLIDAILGRSEMVLGDCRTSNGTISELRMHTRKSLATSETGEAGVCLGRDLLVAMRSAALSVQKRFEIILGRKEQLSTQLRSLCKTAERVRIVSFHAAMEAESAAGGLENFRYVAQESRDLGYRLDVSALNIERTLRRIEALVTQSSDSLGVFCQQLAGSFTHLERVEQSLGGNRLILMHTDERLQQAMDLLSQQESQVRNLQECAKTMEYRQQGGVADRTQIQSLLTALASTLERVRWAAGGTG